MKNIIKLALLFLFCQTSLLAQSGIQHVEPLNWWVGIKDPNVQLLVNGPGVGSTTPSIRYPGVTVKKATKADSDNYLFVDLVIAKNTKPGTFTIHFNKGGKSVYSWDYTLLPRQQTGAQYKGFDASDVVYLVVPDRFANGDSTNDVVAGMREGKIDRKFDGGRHGGDIRGIINHLDYIADMGFTAIWPTPMLENDMKAYSYHGYSITNHYKVDPRYGTLDDYKELSVKARQKGIKLIFDEVLNHSGSNYWWMNDLPFKDWINNTGAYTPSNHRRTTNQDMYGSHYDSELMTKGWFDTTMPDMNSQNPFMANYLIQNTIWWIETLQLGGIRQDTYGYSDKTFLQKWSYRLMDEYPNFSMVGEEWSLNPLITSYWQKGKRNADGYKSYLPCVMDFPLQSALIEGLKEPEDNNYAKGFSRLYEALANDFVYADPKKILVFGDNHDMDRLFMQLNNDADLTKMALTYLLTIRGIPQVFYGTEILMENTGHHKVDGLIRSDFPGGWAGDAKNGFTGKGLTPEQQSAQNYVKQLLNWRKQHPVIANGNTMHFAPFNGVYVYFRYNKNAMVMVVMNKNATETKVNTQRFAEIIKDKTTAVNALTNQSFDVQNGVTVPGKTAVVFEIK